MISTSSTLISDMMPKLCHHSVPVSGTTKGQKVSEKKEIWKTDCLIDV